MDCVEAMTKITHLLLLIWPHMKNTGLPDKTCEDRSLEELRLTYNEKGRYHTQ